MRIDQLITGNDDVQRHVASDREKQALITVSPMARRAIKLEVLPQIEESVFSVDSAEEMCADTKRAIEAAFSYKNPLYTRLVSYKGIEQSDNQYLADLMVVMDEWLRATKAGLEEGAEEKDDEDEDETKAEAAPAGASKDQEVNVDVNVNVNGQEQNEEDDESTASDEELVEFADQGAPAPSNVLKTVEAEDPLQLKDTDDGPEIDLDDPMSLFGLEDVRL